MNLLQLKHRENIRLTYILPALEYGYIAMLYPDKPKSSKQAYYLTEKGKQLYEQKKTGSSLRISKKQYLCVNLLKITAGTDSVKNDASACLTLISKKSRKALRDNILNK